MIYLVITGFVTLYIIGYTQGYNTAIRHVEKMLRRVEHKHQQEALRNLYPDQK